MGRISRKVGGLRNLIFIGLLLVLILIFLLDVYLVDQILEPLGYFYVLFIILVVLYGIYPLYVNRRLTRYYWERTKRHRLSVLGLAFIIFLIAMALIGPLFTQDPTKVNFQEKNLPPVGFTIQQSVYDLKTGNFMVWETPGTWQHPLGADDKGRDMLAMLVSGARVSLQVGMLATLIAILIGTIMGVVSAYLGGFADMALMRFTDVMMTFPFFLLLVFIIFIFGPSLAFIILVIGLTGWTGTARLVRSEALSLRTREFIMASKSLGASDTRIIFRHLIPNVLSTVIVIATLSIPGVILAEAALSFIGLGDPTVTSWGMVLNAGQRSLDTAWWIAVEPGFMLFLTVLAFNFLGDGIRDAFDPRSQV
ncbi:MAG TPA: ABC transporter permease [Dehalococcoidales bacterium]|nr:ABC transporter permease [Dehalococcoidales bacterium]